MENCTLSNLLPGSHALVTSLLAKGSMRRRLMDIGLIEGTDVECVLKSPGGDPVAFQIRGAVVALRNEDSGDVLINIM